MNTCPKTPTVRLVTKRPSRWVNKLRLIGKIDEKNFLILKFSLSNEMRRESEKVPENGKDQGAKTKHDESCAANSNIHHLHPDSDICKQGFTRGYKRLQGSTRGYNMKQGTQGNQKYW